MTPQQKLLKKNCEICVYRSEKIRELINQILNGMKNEIKRVQQNKP